MSRLPVLSQLQARRRQFAWRAVPLTVVFLMGLVAFYFGVQVSDRTLPLEPSLMTSVYYTLGLFVLGGMDLGVPCGGPEVTQILLWAAYFSAPAITTSAILEAVMRVLNDSHLFKRAPRDHVIIGGCGQVGLIFLQHLHEKDPDLHVLVVDLDPLQPSVERARRLYGAEVIVGDITEAQTLASLFLEDARGVYFLTGDNFANLDAAAQVLELAPCLEGRVTTHVSDLRMQRLLKRGGLLQKVHCFNSHHVAAQELVRVHLMAYFERTKERDAVILAGFGRFGQTVLHELQEHAGEYLADVAVLDREARLCSHVFEQQVGRSENYRFHLVEGDVRDPECWHQLLEDLAPDETHPVFVLGSGEEYTNLRTAIWLRSAYPKAFIVVRCFEVSVFAAQIAKQQDLTMVSVGAMLAQNLRSHVHPGECELVQAS